MKTIRLTIMLLLLAIVVKAQTNSAYIEAMKKGIALMEKDSTSEQFTSSANYFARIAQAEPKQWLAQYYTSYATMLIAVLGKQSAEEKDRIYDKALNYAQLADKLQPANSEVRVLKGYITFMKMAVDPQTRSMTMIAEANKYLDEATALNPANPRAYFVKGQDTFYTPEAFGGGPAAAKPLFLMAQQNYNKESITGIEPSWGKSRCGLLLSQCK